MTELAMAISNPYSPISERTQGTIGTPLPGVKASILSESGEILDPSSTPCQGELLIKSECMFDRYLNKPEATAKEFT